MKKNIDVEFLNICLEICQKDLKEEEWRKIESSDMFQTNNYCGGYDATENAFCFSFYEEDGSEFWFQFTLQEALEIAKGKISTINIRLSE